MSTGGAVEAAFPLEGAGVSCLCALSRLSPHPVERWAEAVGGGMALGGGGGADEGGITPGGPSGGMAIQVPPEIATRRGADGSIDARIVRGGTDGGRPWRPEAAESWLDGT